MSFQSLSSALSAVDSFHIRKLILPVYVVPAQPKPCKQHLNTLQRRRSAAHIAEP